VVSVVIRIGRRRTWPGADHRVALVHPAPPVAIDRVDEHDRVVDHDAHSITAPISTITEIVVPVSHQARDHADQRERNGEQHDERVQEALEGRGHHQVDQEDRQGDREAQAVEAVLHLGVLSAQLDAEPFRRRCASQHRLDVVTAAPRLRSGQVRRDHGRPLLLQAVDLRRSAAQRTSATQQPQRPAVRVRAPPGCARPRVWRGPPRVADADVDLPVLLLEGVGTTPCTRSAQRLARACPCPAPAQRGVRGRRRPAAPGCRPRANCARHQARARLPGAGEVERPVAQQFQVSPKTITSTGVLRLK
jgi:hypothetical protein